MSRSTDGIIAQQSYVNRGSTFVMSSRSFNDFFGSSGILHNLISLSPLKSDADKVFSERSYGGGAGHPKFDDNNCRI